jgi:LysR family glycine cleavage system transcriptional activator
MLVDGAVRATARFDASLLLRSTLVTQYLQSGELVCPFEISSPSEFGYYFLCQPERLAEPKISAFRDWLREELDAYGLLQPQ